jgi:hypothetical protein
MRPSMVGPATRDMIPIEGSPSVVPQPSGKTDPYQFYFEHYKSRDRNRIDPEKLRQLVQDLNALGQFRLVHAALVGYLRNQPKLAEPWMYEALAWSIDLNHGSASDVRIALNYAADLAQRTHNPNHLFSVADKMFFKEYYERVGSLLDETMAAVPHRAEPIILSINLAAKTNDPRRMGDSVERLLSLGWPGQDEYMRVEARNQVEALAKTLQDTQRAKEAAALLERLKASEERDVFVRLSWDGQADFDVIVREPLGATASYDIPRTVFGGSVISNGYGSHPEEVYVCPRGFDGDYTISVSTIFVNADKPVTRLTLETIVHDGTAQEKKETYNLDPDKPNKPVVLKLKDGGRRRVLPFIDPMAGQAPWAQELKKNSRGAGGAKRDATPPSGKVATRSGTQPGDSAKKAKP